MATAQMASSEIDDISHVDFDEELSEGSRQNNTEINFEVNNSQSETQSQIIEDLLKKRQPFLMLWKKLKHQKDNKYNSRCLNINFEPILPNKTETLDNKGLESIRQCFGLKFLKNFIEWHIFDLYSHIQCDIPCF